MSSIIRNIFNVRYVTIFCILLILSMLSINTGQCRPEQRVRQRSRVRPTTSAPEELTIHPESEKRVQPCFDDASTMDLCQRCANESKSKEVFPLCCSNVEKVRDWCHEYIYFGQ